MLISLLLLRDAQITVIKQIGLRSDRFVLMNISSLLVEVGYRLKGFRTLSSTPLPSLIFGSKLKCNIVSDPTPQNEEPFINAGRYSPETCRYLGIYLSLGSGTLMSILMKGLLLRGFETPTVACISPITRSGGREWTNAGTATSRPWMAGMQEWGCWFTCKGGKFCDMTSNQTHVF